MMKNDVAVSEKKCAPDEIRAIDTSTPSASATANTRRRWLRASASAIEKNAPAASPEENEQLVSHSRLKVKGGVKCCVPPNSTLLRGRARPKLSLSVKFTIRPGPITSTSNTNRVRRPSMPQSRRLNSRLQAYSRITEPTDSQRK